jgi:glycosyltransferase involved in cell wall biosynthesis
MATVPEVSVVVPARNAAVALVPLLASLAAQTLAPERFEVIVVDNGSSDGTGEVAERHGARVVHEPVANRARARNRGVGAARGALIAFTDADCVARPGWLEHLTACAGRAPLVAGNVVTTTSERPNAIERFEVLWRFGQESWVKEGWAATANLLIGRELLQQLGGFDETFHHVAEDAELCLRAGRAGHRLGYCGEAVVEHLGERDMLPFLGRFWRHGYSSVQAVRRMGVGYRAWRRPLPALYGDAALRSVGAQRASFSRREWRTMARIARLGYAARIAGSLSAELRRAR